MLPCQAENLKEKKSGRRDVFISRGRFIFYSQRSVIFVDGHALEQRVKRCLLRTCDVQQFLQNFSTVIFLLSLGLCSIIWLKTHARFIGIHLAERQADLWKQRFMTWCIHKNNSTYQHMAVLVYHRNQIAAIFSPWGEVTNLGCAATGNSGHTGDLKKQKVILNDSL